MKESQKLYREAHGLFEQAKAVLVAGGDGADDLTAKAEAIMKRAKSLEVIEEQQKTLTDPIRNVPFPTDDNANNVQNPNGHPAPNDPAIIGKAVNQIRFGEPDAAIKAVLTDLYGPEYDALRWKQTMAFNRYLRVYNRPPSLEDEKLLSQVILTPAYAKKAIQEGWDVESLKSTMVEGMDTLGGYAVPIDFQARVIERLMGLVVMRGRAFGMTTSRDRVEIPKATGGTSQYQSAVRVTWVDETPTTTQAETNLTFGLEGIPVNTVMASTPLSRNLVEDAAVNLTDYLSRQFASAAAIDEDNRFLTGDGVGKPQGLLPGGANTNAFTEQVSGAAADMTSWNAITNLTYKIDAQYRQQAAFIGAKATYGKIATMVDGVGQPLWREQYGRGTSEGGAGSNRMLQGYTVLEQEAMPAVAANAFPLLFGDPEGYYIVDRIGMTIERFLDATTARQNQVVYVMRRRLGGQTVEPWRFSVLKCSV